MRSRSFRSVGWVATIASAALGCYLVSLRVASERAALEGVETEIVLAQRDIRLLQTEIGTRGRLAQLERWNVKVLALSAPSADQFVEGGYALAKLAQPEHKVDLDAPVILASAPVVNPPAARIIEADYRPGEASQPSFAANDLMHQAGLRQVSRAEPIQIGEPARKAATPPKPTRTEARSGAAKPAAASARKSTGDPLAPLPTAKLIVTATASSGSTLKDSGQAR